MAMLACVSPDSPRLRSFLPIVMTVATRNARPGNPSTDVSEINRWLFGASCGTLNADDRAAKHPAFIIAAFGSYRYRNGSPSSAWLTGSPSASVVELSSTTVPPAVTPVAAPSAEPARASPSLADSIFVVPVAAPSECRAVPTECTPVASAATVNRSVPRAVMLTQWTVTVTSSTGTASGCPRSTSSSSLHSFATATM